MLERWKRWAIIGVMTTVFLVACTVSVTLFVAAYIGVVD
jgi:hypothetical protein